MADTGTFTYWLDGLPVVVIVKGTSTSGSFLYWEDGLPGVEPNTGDAPVTSPSRLGLLGVG
jgi:hypothetical protein